MPAAQEDVYRRSYMGEGYKFTFFAITRNELERRYGNAGKGLSLKGHRELFTQEGSLF